MRLSLLCLVVVAACVAACATAPVARPPDPAVVPQTTAQALPPAAEREHETPGLVFAVEPADAEVVVDETSYGKVSALPAGAISNLKPGMYQVSLKKAGYTPWRAEVTVRGVEKISVTLVPK